MVDILLKITRAPRFPPYFWTCVFKTTGKLENKTISWKTTKQKKNSFLKHNLCAIGNRLIGLLIWKDWITFTAAKSVNRKQKKAYKNVRYLIVVKPMAFSFYTLPKKKKLRYKNVYPARTKLPKCCNDLYFCRDLNFNGFIVIGDKTFCLSSRDIINNYRLELLSFEWEGRW